MLNELLILLLQDLDLLLQLGDGGFGQIKRLLFRDTSRFVVLALDWGP